MWAIT
jgi:hypothetical protein